jgi:hypothetical protein
MHELACPSCNAPSQYDFRDYLLMCPFCSTSFHFDLQTGQKDIYQDHYIIPNSADARGIKELVREWLRRMHHRPGATDKEFFVVDIKGVSVPYWVVSLEGHTVWKGLVRRQHRSRLDNIPGSEYLVERGQFRRSYRWAVSARNNICESWGMTRLHEPKEELKVEWDGFPLDSTLSRGRVSEAQSEKRNAYDQREFFEFKFANGLPIMGVQVNEEEALRRAKAHVNLYHYKLAQLNVDFLIDHRTELEIAGIQLIHLPFWKASYVYRPSNVLRHLYTPKEKHLVLDGHSSGVLKAELAIVHKDKILVNSIVCALAAVLFLMLGFTWHPAFYFVALFALAIGVASGVLAAIRQKPALSDENVTHGGLRGTRNPEVGAA